MSLNANAQQRSTLDIRNWEFSHDSVEWKNVIIPHDWAISGPFDKKWDLQNVAIVQNGEKQKTEKSGRSGALPWIGQGFYRTTINLKQLPPHAMLVFDGAMAEPRVLVNGKYAGYWAYGYNSFRLDVTRLLRKGDNTIEVHLQNVEESSRWYPGAGLYRPVTLTVTDKVHLEPWKTVVKTQRVTGTKHAKAVMSLRTTLAGASRDFRGMLKLTLLDNTTGEEKTLREMPVEGETFLGGFIVATPKLWSPEKPNLYTLKLTLADSQGNDLDNLSMRFGIRTVKVDSIHGFRLNGESRKIKAGAAFWGAPALAFIRRERIGTPLKGVPNCLCSTEVAAHHLHTFGGGEQDKLVPFLRGEPQAFRRIRRGLFRQAARDGVHLVLDILRLVVLQIPVGKISDAAQRLKRGILGVGAVVGQIRPAQVLPQQGDIFPRGVGQRFPAGTQHPLVPHGVVMR